MKNELRNIIKHEVRNFRFHDELLKSGYDLIDFYMDNHSSFKSKFKDVLNKYNINTVSEFSEFDDGELDICLFISMGEFCPTIAVQYEDGIGEFDEEIGELISSPYLFKDPEYIFADDEYYFGTKYGLIQSNLFFTFISSVWKELQGWKYGLVYKTLENNSTTQFYLNDYSWDDLSSYNYESKNRNPNHDINSISLTTLDLYQRAYENYPRNPYKNRWRKFTKDDKQYFIVRYDSKTGTKDQLNGIMEVKNHYNLKDAIQFEYNFSIELLKKGYTEIIYDTTDKLSEDSIETDYFCGIHWYKNEIKHRLSHEQITQFEESNKIQLPKFFKNYLRLLNGRQYNSHYLKFWVIDKYIKIDKFYTIDEICEVNGLLLNRNHPHQIEWLKVGIADGCIIELKLSNDKLNDGKIRIKTNRNEVILENLKFEELVKSAAI